MDKFEIRRKALESLRDKLGYGAIAKIASEIGKEPNYVSRMLYPPGKPGRKRIGEDSAEALDKAFPGWLDHEDATVTLRSEGLTPLDKKTGIVTIPRYETGGSMGHGVVLRDQPGVIESWQVSTQWLAENVRGYTTATNLCLITGFGDSMRPTYNPGDPLIVDKGVTTVPYDSVYFFRVGDEGYVKRLQRVPTSNGLIYRAISDNPSYLPFDIDQSMDFQVLARVVQVWRREDY